MKLEHKIIREMLGKMPIPAAKEILQTNLPLREFQAIYYVDIEQETLLDVGWKYLKCEESTIKKYRRSGYEKLAAIYFPQKNNIIDSKALH